MNILTLDSVRDQAPAAFATVPHPRTSSKYSLFRTADVVESLVEDGWQITRAGQARYRTETQREYSRHIVALSRPELTYQDEQIEALFVNSNDGRSTFRLELGVWRFICANGMIDASAKFSELQIKHFGYLPEQVQQAAHKVVERAPEVVGVIDAWKTKFLSPSSVDELAQYALALRYPAQDAPISARELVGVRRREDEGNDLWHVFNRVQENILRGGFEYEKKGRNLRVRPIRSIRTNLNVNKSLWSAAESLYQGEDLVLPA
jgi:Domain of unknown function (DUF932)